MSRQSRNTGTVGSAHYVVDPRLQRVASSWVDMEMVTVRKMAADAASAEDIGAAIGWTPGRVRRFVKANNIVWNHRIRGNELGGGHKSPEGWKEKATELRLAGMSLHSISEAIGVTFSVVGQHLRDTGVPDPGLKVGRKPSGKAPKPPSDRKRQRLCSEALRKSAGAIA